MCMLTELLLLAHVMEQLLFKLILGSAQVLAVQKAPCSSTTCPVVRTKVLVLRTPELTRERTLMSLNLLDCARTLPSMVSVGLLVMALTVVVSVPLPLGTLLRSRLHGHPTLQRSLCLGPVPLLLVLLLCLVTRVPAIVGAMFVGLVASLFSMSSVVVLVLVGSSGMLNPRLLRVAETHLRLLVRTLVAMCSTMWVCPLSCCVTVVTWVGLLGLLMMTPVKFRLTVSLTLVLDPPPLRSIRWWLGMFVVSVTYTLFTEYALMSTFVLAINCMILPERNVPLVKSMRAAEPAKVLVVVCMKHSVWVEILLALTRHSGDLNLLSSDLVACLRNARVFLVPIVAVIG